MAGRLEGKVAVVTGGGLGHGQSIASSLIVAKEVNPDGWWIE